MSSTSPGEVAPTSAKRTAGISFTERRQRRKMEQTTVIKMGFTKVCKSEAMADLVRDCVQRCSLIAVKASLLTTYHVARVLDSDEQLPELNQTFFYRCISSVANFSSVRSCEGDDARLAESAVLFERLHPAGYTSVHRHKGLTQMIKFIGSQAHENFEVSVQSNILSRLRRWLRMKLIQRSATGDVAAAPSSTKFYTD